nr:pirin-like C-terminal cupin domain-containing protein [Kofleriaceae bacterium]
MRDPVIATVPLGFQWPTPDPFLFCVHHDDAYPRGDGSFGPEASLAGRELGSDFAGKDGWRMYHGRTVPGFPQHPHRGFETVTIARRGLIDHSDSLGAAARFGRGDVQWLTAGSGINHSEMFPLVERDRDNPVELFQIWLNLPRASKLVAPYFTMLWSEQLPRRAADGVDIVAVAGKLGELSPLAPPPDSWASRPEGDVAIWTIKLQPGATTTLPPARAGTNRVVYVFRGTAVVGGKPATKVAVQVVPDVALPIVATDDVEILVLQGRPIGEPVAQHGPFVMNTRQEIEQAFADYRRTQFGGWPWPKDDPVHGGHERFAKYPDGREESPQPAQQSSPAS